MMHLIKNSKIVVCSILSLGCLLCNSCNNLPLETGATFHKTFITGYLIPEHIQIGGAQSKISLLVKGNVITSGAFFDELAKYYNDLSYNRYVASGPCTVISEMISEIKVETIEDFDNNHLAGSDISDIIELQYISYYEYVQNGYQEENKGNREDYDDMYVYYQKDGAKIFKGNLSEIKFADMRLVTPDFVLRFQTNPSQKGLYKFKLIFQMHDKVIETLFEHHF